MDKNSHEYASAIAEEVRAALDSKKGMDISVIPVEQQTPLCDFFVIATGTSSSHLKALAEEAEFKVREALQIEPTRIEGANDSRWVLIDYGCVIVHIFTKDGRDFYKLDKLWKSE